MFTIPIIPGSDLPIVPGDELPEVDPTLTPITPIGPSDPGTITAPEAQSLSLLYEAAFNRSPDIPGLNYWIDEYEDGRGILDIALLFIGSQEFANSYGAPSSILDEQFVEILYLNILNRPGEDAGIEFWTGQLATGVDRQSVLADFAVSPENVEGSGYVQTLTNDGGGYWDFVPSLG